MKSQPALRADGLVRRFGSANALDGVDFEVGAGSILGLLGHNGAGKTTAVRIVATLLRPTAGRVEVCGHDVVRRPASVRRSLSLAGQEATLDALLTGRENLVLLGRLLGLRRPEAGRRAVELLERFQIADAADRVVGGYSGGMRRRLDLAACLLVPRPVVLLDEPTTGLDPASRREVWAAVRELVAEGTSALLTTQYLEDAEQLADDIVVLAAGRVVARGTPAEMKDGVGGRRVEARLERAGALAQAASAFVELGLEPELDERTQTVSAAAPRGGHDLAAVLAALGEGEIAVAEAALRRPTLDDAFLALTGASPEPAAAATTTEAVTG